MSTRRNPVYVFKNKDSGGVYDVPLGSMIQVIDADGAGTPSFSQILGKNGVGPSSTIEQYLNSNTPGMTNYVTLDKDTTYGTATDIADGLMSAADFTKLDTVEAGATADQTRDDINLLDVDAATVKGFHVGTSVPSSAVFTDTTYNPAPLEDRVVIVEDRTITNTSNISGNATAILTNDGLIANNTTNILVNSGLITANGTAISNNGIAIAANGTAISNNGIAIAANGTAISNNAADILTNTAAIEGHVIDISDNADDIVTNADAIASNGIAIVTNAANISTNITAIDLNTTHKNLTTNNPHQVTKSEVGLGNVDNTADATKAAPGNVIGDAIAAKLTAIKGGAVADSVGTTIAENATAINGLLASLRTAGIIA